MSILLLAIAAATQTFGTVAVPTTGWYTNRSGIAAANGGSWTVEVRDIDISDDAEPARSRLIATYDVVEGETVESGAGDGQDPYETTTLSVRRTSAGPVLHVEEQGLLGTRVIATGGGRSSVPITYATQFDLPLVSAGADRLAGSYDLPSGLHDRPMRRMYVMTPVIR